MRDLVDIFKRNDGYKLIYGSNLHREAADFHYSRGDNAPQCYGIGIPLIKAKDQPEATPQTRQENFRTRDKMVNGNIALIKKLERKLIKIGAFVFEKPAQQLPAKTNFIKERKEEGAAREETAEPEETRREINPPWFTPANIEKWRIYSQIEEAGQAWYHATNTRQFKETQEEELDFYE